MGSRIQEKSPLPAKPDTTRYRTTTNKRRSAAGMHAKVPRFGRGGNAENFCGFALAAGRGFAKSPRSSLRVLRQWTAGRNSVKTGSSCAAVTGYDSPLRQSPITRRPRRGEGWRAKARRESRSQNTPPVRSHSCRRLCGGTPKLLRKKEAMRDQSARRGALAPCRVLVSHQPKKRNQHMKKTLLTSAAFLAASTALFAQSLNITAPVLLSPKKTRPLSHRTKEP